jgi:hypothetical protein
MAPGRPRAEHLHVLLRHRLLPQPGGFEGFLEVPEEANLRNLAVLHAIGTDNSRRYLGQVSWSRLCQGSGVGYNSLPDEVQPR